jgi:WD40 repeat protein
MNSPGTSWKFPSFFFLEALSYAPDLQSAIMGGRDGTLVLWDIKRGEAKRELSGPLRRWDVHVAKPIPIFHHSSYHFMILSHSSSFHHS